MPDRSEAEQLNAIAIPPAETLARQLFFRRTCFQQTSLVQKMTFLSSINPARAVSGRRCPHSGEGGLALFDMPNLNRFDIDIFQNHHINIDIDIDIFGIALSISISISIFSKMTISISISISIFFKSVDISTIDMSYRYIEQGYWRCGNRSQHLRFFL